MTAQRSLRIIFLTLLAFGVISGAEPAPDSDKPLTGFFGIPFGTSMADCKRIMLSKEGAEFDPDNSDQTTQFFNDVVFGGRACSFVMLSFVDDKFCSASVAFRAKLEAKTQELFDGIHDDLDAKYYKTTQNLRDFKSPYEDGDGHEMTAVKLGKADITSLWTFKASKGKNNDVIMLDITPSLSVNLSYVCGTLEAQRSGKQKEHRRKDF